MIHPKLKIRNNFKYLIIDNKRSNFCRHCSKIHNDFLCFAHVENKIVLVTPGHHSLHFFLINWFITLRYLAAYSGVIWNLHWDYRFMTGSAVVIVDITHPWGAPVFSTIGCEILPCTLTTWDLLNRKSRIHLHIWGSTCQLSSNLSYSFCGSMVLNADENSKNKILT